MTIYTGQNGVVQIGNVALAEVRGFTFELTSETIDASVMGDSFRGYRKGMINGQGTMDLLFSSTHETPLIDSITGSTSATIILYPGGNVSGYPSMTIKGWITGYSIESTMDDMVTASATFQLDGSQSTPFVTANMT